MDKTRAVFSENTVQIVQVPDDALAAIESWTKGGGATIAKETNFFIDYVNRTGKTIHIPKQSGKNIDNAIAAKLKSTDAGEQTEAKVANFIRNELGKEFTDFGNKVTDSDRQPVGDIDCGMEDVLIEVKTSVNSLGKKQFEKYTDYDHEQFINILNKKVILYIDQPIGELGAADREKLESIEKMGVTIVNGLEELKGVLK